MIGSLSYSQTDVFLSDPQLSSKQIFVIWLHSKKEIPAISSIELFNTYSEYLTGQEEENIYKRVLRLISNCSSLRLKIKEENGKRYQELQEPTLKKNKVHIQDTYNLILYSYPLDCPVLNTIIGLNNKKLVRLDIHHCFFDGMSRSIFLDDFYEVNRYEESLSYLDWCVFEKENVKQLTCSEVEQWYTLDLPYNTSQDLLETPYMIRSHCFTVPRILESIKIYRVTPYVLYIATLMILMSKITNQDTIVMCGVSSNRHFPLYSKMIGLFTKLVFYKVRFDSETTLLKIVRMAKEQIDSSSKSFDYIRPTKQLTSVVADISLGNLNASPPEGTLSKYQLYFYFNNIDANKEIKWYSPVGLFSDDFAFQSLCSIDYIFNSIHYSDKLVSELLNNSTVFPILIQPTKLLEWSIKVNEVHSTLGVIIEGVKLTDAIWEIPEYSLYLKNLLWKYKVISFKNQNCTINNMEQVASVFGIPCNNIMNTDSSLNNTIGNIQILKRNQNNNDSYPLIFEANWHTDHVCQSNRPAYTMLYSEKTPSEGGETFFKDSTYVVNHLPNKLLNDLKEKKVIQGLTRYSLEEAIKSNGQKSFGSYLFLPKSHSNEEIKNIESLIPDSKYMKQENIFSIQPSILSHPHTNELSLNINPSFSKHILGVSKSESTHILDSTIEYWKKHSTEYKLEWEEHMITIWDNRLVLHRATQSKGERLIYRLMISDPFDTSKKTFV